MIKLNEIVNKKIYTSLLYITIWSLFVFSILKFLFVTRNEPFLIILIYSLFSYLFSAYYFFNTKIRLSLGGCYLSYFIISVFVYILQLIYSSLFLISKFSPINEKFIFIFGFGMVPIIVFYYIGIIIFRIIK